MFLLMGVTGGGGGSEGGGGENKKWCKRFENEKIISQSDCDKHGDRVSKNNTNCLYLKYTTKKDSVWVIYVDIQ